MTSISKNVYTDKLDDAVNKCNNTYLRKIKMKPIHVKTSTYIDLDVENNDEDPKFKVGGDVRIQNIRLFLQKSTWSKEVLLLKK